MFDQAHDLRRLASQRIRPAVAHEGRRPSLLVTAGGKGGVGTTTVAIQLAAALTPTGQRVVLVDADPRGGDVALRCGAEERHNLGDLLSGRRAWGEVVETAPNGLRLVAGCRWPDDWGNHSSTASQDWVERLTAPNSQADVIVVDIGNGLDRAARRICQAAEAIVMVTSSETAAVMGTFAAIKTLTRSAGGPNQSDRLAPLYLRVNKARSTREARTIHYRLERACRRLLGVEIARSDVIQERLNVSAPLADMYDETGRATYC
jgi:flagellar biosynthesis protein FlhG